MLRRCLLLLALAPLACSDETGSGEVPPDPRGCGPGEHEAADGTCIPAGLPAGAPCAPGQWLHQGSCAEAGVPPGGCGDGFVHDGDRGCQAVLPDEACEPGQMALPGEAECRPVAPCGTGTWGDIVTDSSTQHVDGSYTGGNSDGSAAAPWTTLFEALQAASDHATVAVAAGTYDANVSISKPVTLWGRCPDMVTIAGTGISPVAVRVVGGGDGVRLRGLGITGAAHGVLVAGATDVVLEHLWVHDTAGRGFSFQAEANPTEVTLRDSLVEHCGGFGVRASGVTVAIQNTVVRDTVALSPDTEPGRGVSVEVGPTTGEPATITLDHCVIEDNRDVGLFVLGSLAAVSATAIRRTWPGGVDLTGHGVHVAVAPDDLRPAELSMTTSVVAESHGLGVFADGAVVTLDAAVVRDTRQTGGGTFGRGVSLQAASVDVRRSLIDRSYGVGLLLGGSTATLQALAIRDTDVDYDGLARGVQIQDGPSGERSVVAVEGALVEGGYLGVYADNSDLTMAHSLVGHTTTTLAGFRGRGIAVGGEAEPTLHLHGVLVESTTEAAIFVADAEATLASCLVRDTAAGGDQLIGDGIVVASMLRPAQAVVTATRVEGSARVAVAAFGGSVALGGNQLRCQSVDLLAVPFADVPGALDDLGGNVCGCPEATAACALENVDLAPPEPVGGLE